MCEVSDALELRPTDELPEDILLSKISETRFSIFFRSQLENVGSVSSVEPKVEFILEVKRVNPQAEIIVYIYTPIPLDSLSGNARAHAAAAPAALLDVNGDPIRFPETPEEWTQQCWVDYSCHADAPWMSDKLRRRIQNFVTVLGCRFPTVQDVRSPSWAKTTLRTLASWRYAWQKYDRPWELALSKKLVRLADPRATSL